MKELPKGDDPARVKMPDVEGPVLLMIKTVLREMDLIGGKYPYDVIQGWPDWYQESAALIRTLWPMPAIWKYTDEDE